MAIAPASSRAKEGSFHMAPRSQSFMHSIFLPLSFSILTLAIGGCGGGSSSGSSGPASVGSSGGPTASASSQHGASDQQVCETACAKLVACGVDYGAACVDSCRQASTFVACLRESDLQDCNAIALCNFKQGAATSCGGADNGVPAGNGSCRAAADCTGQCTLAGQGAACACGCTANLSPDKAMDLLVNDACATTKCPASCSGPAPQGAACMSCFQANCANEIARCQSN
jgi:hypothetical protein